MLFKVNYNLNHFLNNQILSTNQKHSIIIISNHFIILQPIKYQKLILFNRTNELKPAKNHFRQKLKQCQKKSYVNHLKNIISVEHTLNKKNELIDKYQTEIQDLIEQIDSKNPARKSITIASHRSRDTGARKNRLSASFRNQTNQNQKQLMISGSMKDYQKLILGLQYALQSQRKKCQSLTQKNNSLQSQISNLRNVLVGPDQSKQYQKTIVKQLQQKINSQQDKMIDQKKNYEFIIQSKNEAITSLQTQLRTIQKQFESKLSEKQKFNKNDKQNGLTKKILQLMNNIEQMRSTITRKNIIIQNLKYRKIQFHAIQDDQSDDQIKKIRKVEKIKFYQQQLQISNKMIIKKNIQILNLSNKLMKFQQIMDVVEMYLDKKEVKNIDLNILQTAVITKLRILLRQKATFQRQLLSQLNDHNKKITNFQKEITSKQSLTSNKLTQVVTDNKRLTSLISSLQLNINNLQKALNDEKRQNQYLKNQNEINKKQFVQQIKRLKGDLGTISSVTKNQFDRMKIQNLKLSQQNRSLLFLVGQKERQIHRKGQTIKDFKDYRQKINSLDISINQAQKRKIQKASEDSPQIGSKMLLISSFSSWMFEWNKIKSWNNKKVLLNLILDKQQIRVDALNSINMLIDVIHECLLHSKNVQIQQRAIILLCYFINQSILKHSSLYLDKIVPILVRGFRQNIEGQEAQKHRLLNESTLKIFHQLSKNDYVWNQQLTNQMLSVNGLKYLFVLINQNPIDDLVEMGYDILIMITKQNQMVSFMISFNVAELILKNMNNKYKFIQFSLELLKNLLNSDDFMRSQKSFLQYRKITNILKQDDDQDVLFLAFQCLQVLIQKSSPFIKSLNKLQAVSILNGLLKNHTGIKLLKKLSSVYGLIVQNFQDDSLDKFIRAQVQKVLKIINQKNISDQRFLVSLKIVLKIAEQINQRNDLDQKIIESCFSIYELYESLDQKAKMRLNKILEVIYQRNKNVINKYSTDNFITNLVESYKSTSVIQQILILLKILLFQNEQKHSTQILRSGRQNYIDKLINDCMLTKNYQVSILALKNLLAITRQKYIQKFINIKQVSKIVNKVLKQRGEEEYLSLAISVLYFLSKNQQASVMTIQSHAVEKVAQLMIERHDKQALIFKSFALLQLLHTMNYKRKVLNYFLSSDPKLQITKTFNYILRRAQNKTQMGTRAVFYYDFLLSKGSIQSLTILIQSNDWMIQDLISTRNEYIGKVDSLVYKIELILNSVCQKSKKLNKIYQRFKVQGDISSGDQDD